MLEVFDYVAAASPADESLIAELRRRLSDSGFPDTELTEEYTAFLRESNGGDFVKNGREFQMFAAEEIPGFYNSYMFPVYMPYAFPVGMDGCGNFYIFNKRKEDNGVYIVAAGNMGWGNDECFLLAESFGECISGKFV